jgi:Kef-type K+ transport system membrane component KefB
MKDSPIFIIALALIAVCGTLGGVWLGSRLTRRNEDRKWRRDHALEVYSEFLSAVETVISEAGMAYGAPCGTEEHTRRREAVMDKVADMHRLSSRLILLSPDALEAPFWALSNFITSELLIMAIECPKASADERKASNKKLATFLSTFMVVARQDLGIHPPLEMPKKLWWQFWR